jgi:prevent-host-death family protein
MRLKMGSGFYMDTSSVKRLRQRRIPPKVRCACWHHIADAWDKPHGQVRRQVKKDGPQVITQNGTPAAYLIPASARGIEADLDALRRLLLGRALDASRLCPVLMTRFPAPQPA